MSDAFAPARRTAHTALIPLARDLFCCRPIATRAGPTLPLREPRALSAEAVDLLCRLIPHGTLIWLMHRGGWQALPAALDTTEHAALRLSAAALRPHLRLSFGPAAIDALIVAYDAFAERHCPDPKRPGQIAGYTGDAATWEAITPDRFEHTGDVLVHHAALCALDDAAVPLSAPVRAYFRANPLNRIFRLEAGESDVHWLLTGPLAPLLPWLSAHLAAGWRRQHDRRHGTQRRFEWFHRRLAELHHAWAAAARDGERPDLAAPLLDYHRRLWQAPDAETTWRRDFEHMVAELPRRRRTELQDAWALSLTPLLELRELYMAARGLHPIEREPAHRVFMKAWERDDFDTLADRARALHDELRGVVGATTTVHLHPESPS